MYCCKMKLLCVTFLWCVVVVMVYSSNITNGPKRHYHKKLLHQELGLPDEDFDVNKLQFENEEQRREFNMVLNNVNTTRGSGTYLKLDVPAPIANHTSAFRFPLFHDNDDDVNDVPVIHKVWYYRPRVKRFTVQQQRVWYHDNVTWSLFTQVLPFARKLVVKELTNAFDMWQNTITWRNKTMLRFTQLSDNNTSANIKLYFTHGDHNDSFPFDGPNGIIAHAFLPPYGRIHFDADESWNLTGENMTISEEGINLFVVAAHEIGHAIGFQHSSVRKAIMFAFYNSANNKLNVDDINGLNQLYSDNPFRTTTTTTTTTTTAAPSTTTDTIPVRRVNKRNLIFERFLPLWLWKKSLEKHNECVVAPSDMMMIGNRLYMTVAGKVWSYDNNGTIHNQGVPITSLWRDLCNADAMIAIGDVVIATYKNVWYEYKKGVLNYVGRVQDVLINATRVDTFVLEHDNNAPPRLYATYGNKFYVLDIASRRRVYRGLLRDKFRGVGVRIDYFVHFPDSQVHLVGIGRGVWSVRVVTVDPQLGNVYEAVKGLQKVLQHC